MQLIDTHSHLYLPEFDQDREEAVARALAAGVGKLILPNVDLSTIGPMTTLCEHHPSVCFPAMALHPTSVEEDADRVMAEIARRLQSDAYIAIGECGIDLYWDQSRRDLQVEVFREHLRWAKRLQLPVIVHCRNAFEDVMAVLEQEQDNTLRGVFHCFSGDTAQAMRVVEAGFCLGIGGVVTYKNNRIAEVITSLGLDAVVLETDCPYLAFRTVESGMRAPL